MGERIRILVADDHPVVREGLVAILSTQADFDVVGEAADGAAVVAHVAALRPDVALLDLVMPGMDGVEALEQLRERHLETRTIVFTAFDTDERLLRAVQAGAQGYLLKGVPRDDIFRAIRIVHSGGSLLTPLVVSRLLRGRASEEEQPFALTPRELDVLRLLAHGLQNKEIAAALTIGERTVKFHVGSVLRKLGAGNRTEAVATAAQRGLISLAERP